MATFQLPDVLLDWLHSHPGSRLILNPSHSGFGIELCARQLDGLKIDEDRYVNHDQPCSMRAIVEMVEQMIAWEAEGWTYEDEGKLLTDIFGPLPDKN
jgi:hypothetical protein